MRVSSSSSFYPDFYGIKTSKKYIYFEIFIYIVIWASWEQGNNSFAHMYSNRHICNVTAMWVHSATLFSSIAVETINLSYDFITHGNFRIIINTSLYFRKSLWLCYMNNSIIIYVFLSISIYNYSRFMHFAFLI